MRYLVIAAALLVTIVLMSANAQAADHGRGIQIVNNNYVVNDNYYGGRDYGYGYRGNRGDYYRYRYRSFQGHNEAVARIQAMHSPYSRTRHPLSSYNDPPVYYGPRW